MDVGPVEMLVISYPGERADPAVVAALGEALAALAEAEFEAAKAKLLGS